MKVEPYDGPGPYPLPYRIEPPPYLVEGMIRQYEVLDKYYWRTKGDRPPPQACMTCYWGERECLCSPKRPELGEQDLWPVYVVRLRLKNRIQYFLPEFETWKDFPFCGDPAVDNSNFR
jgi:hypothetical protein